MFLHRNNWIVPAVRALLLHKHRGFAFRLLGYCTLNIGRNGYLPLSYGKWAFAGQFLTAVAEYYRHANQSIDEGIARYSQVKSIARWIIRKRHEVSHAPKKPAGLFPPGTTPNGVGREYIISDNLWGIEGLAAASWLARQHGEHSDADKFHQEHISFASALSAAIHREMEYGILQKTPGRLHRAYDPSSAAELLNLAMTHETRCVFLPQESWIPQLLKDLAAPATQPTGHQPLMALDHRGIRPAHHLLLAMLCHEAGLPGIAPSIESVESLVTASGAWSEILDINRHNGLGTLHFDPETAALYLILSQKLNTSANNHEI